MPPPGRTPWLAYACLAGSMSLVGVYVALSKVLVAAFPVFLLAGLRFALAAVAMAGWVRRAPGEPPLAAVDRQRLFWISFIGQFLFSVCMLYGVALAGALAAGIVMAGIPAAVAVLSWRLLREPVSARTWAAVACAVAAVAVLAWARHAQGAPLAPGAAGADGAALGFALLLAAVGCEAAYVVIGKRLTASVAPRRISALMNLAGLAVVAPFALWQARGFDFAAVALSTWGLLLFYALAASVVTVLLWMRGLRDVPAARAGIFSVCLPLAAVAVGVGVLGEPFGLMHAAAMAMALAAVLLATWPVRGRPA